ncbi:hypothetical protein DIPPA_11573 [Diplonema papillatum]|nr:hypothetical protein DIPPA_11573 [Diplonema papillatum]
MMSHSLQNLGTAANAFLAQGYCPGPTQGPGFLPPLYPGLDVSAHHQGMGMALGAMPMLPPGFAPSGAPSSFPADSCAKKRPRPQAGDRTPVPPQGLSVPPQALSTSTTAYVPPGGGFSLTSTTMQYPQLPVQAGGGGGLRGVPSSSSVGHCGDGVFTPAYPPQSLALEYPEALGLRSVASTAPGYYYPLVGHDGKRQRTGASTQDYRVHYDASTYRHDMYQVPGMPLVVAADEGDDAFPCGNPNCQAAAALLKNALSVVAALLDNECRQVRASPAKDSVLRRVSAIVAKYLPGGLDADESGSTTPSPRREESDAATPSPGPSENHGTPDPAEPPRSQVQQPDEVQQQSEHARSQGEAPGQQPRDSPLEGRAPRSEGVSAGATADGQPRGEAPYQPSQGHESAVPLVDRLRAATADGQPRVETHQAQGRDPRQQSHGHESALPLVDRLRAAARAPPLHAYDLLKLPAISGKYPWKQVIRPACPPGAALSDEMAERVDQRWKQVIIGLLTPGHRNFIRAYSRRYGSPRFVESGVVVPPEDEAANESENDFFCRAPDASLAPLSILPCPPDIYEECSKRVFDKKLKLWRRNLHVYDTETDDVSSSSLPLPALLPAPEDSDAGSEDSLASASGGDRAGPAVSPPPGNGRLTRKQRRQAAPKTVVSQTATAPPCMPPKTIVRPADGGGSRPPAAFHVRFVGCPTPPATPAPAPVPAPLPAPMPCPTAEEVASALQECTIMATMPTTPSPSFETRTPSSPSAEDVSDDEDDDDDDDDDDDESSTESDTLSTVAQCQDYTRFVAHHCRDVPIFAMSAPTLLTDEADATVADVCTHSVC